MHSTPFVFVISIIKIDRIVQLCFNYLIPYSGKFSWDPIFAVSWLINELRNLELL